MSTTVDRFPANRTASNRCGVTLMDNQNPEDAAEYISFDLQALS
jgi:hypothetical protein